MKNTEAIERCKILIEEEKMLKQQKAILQGEKFADTVPSVQTVIDDIDDYLAKIPDAIKDSIAAIEPEKPSVAVTVSNDAVAALAFLALVNAIQAR